MAPTRPLVAQQLEACTGLYAGIPRQHAAELLATKAEDRDAVWREKRVFFCTPQARALRRPAARRRPPCPSPAHGTLAAAAASLPPPPRRSFTPKTNSLVRSPTRADLRERPEEGDLPGGGGGVCRGG